MAALSAVKNRKSQKLREGFEDFLARCVERSEGRSEVKIDFVLEMLENMDVKIDAKELKKLDKLGDKNRKISRLMKSLKYDGLIILYQGRLCSVCEEQQSNQEFGGEGDQEWEQTSEQTREQARHSSKEQEECKD